MYTFLRCESLVGKARGFPAVLPAWFNDLTSSDEDDDEEISFPVRQSFVNITFGEEQPRRKKVKPQPPKWSRRISTALEVMEKSLNLALQILKFPGLEKKVESKEEEEEEESLDPLARDQQIEQLEQQLKGLPHIPLETLERWGSAEGKAPEAVRTEMKHLFERQLHYLQALKKHNFTKMPKGMELYRTKSGEWDLRKEKLSLKERVKRTVTIGAWLKKMSKGLMQESVPGVDIGTTLDMTEEKDPNVRSALRDFTLMMNWLMSRLNQFSEDTQHGFQYSAKETHAYHLIANAYAKIANSPEFIQAVKVASTTAAVHYVKVLASSMSGDTTGALTAGRFSRKPAQRGSTTKNS